jgi:hypothetical protein
MRIIKNITDDVLTLRFCEAFEGYDANIENALNERGDRALRIELDPGFCLYTWELKNKFCTDFLDRLNKNMKVTIKFCGDVVLRIFVISVVNHLRSLPFINIESDEGPCDITTLIAKTNERH